MRAGPGANLSESEPDQARIELLLAEIQPDPDLRHGLYVAAVVGTYQHIAANWVDVLRLASELVSRETLSGDDVRSILGEA